MIFKLTGKIDAVYNDHLILDVGGVGYGIFASTGTLTHCRSIDSTNLLIETHVREDHIHLYGFLNIEEKIAFNHLQTVAGIGARVAMNVLSELNPSDIQGAIDTKDKTVFSRVSGIGPKLAERMLLELKNKTFSTSITHPIFSTNKIDHNIIDEASQALINLGINKNEAVNIVKNIMQNSPNATIDQVIRTALQSRG
jgi:Holliday junction DNA helicase RuvA